MAKKTANRQACDITFVRQKDMKVFHYSDYCNTTGISISGDSVKAQKMGRDAMAFQDPMSGTFTMEFQVAPFEVYAFFSNGKIDTSANIFKKETLKGETGGKLTLSEEPVSSTSVAVYEKGCIGEKEIAGSVSTKEFTATSTGDIVKNTEYDVVYAVNKATGVKKISLTNGTVLDSYVAEFSTLDQVEGGAYVGKYNKVYKATPQRNIEFSFSSTGDPQSVTITFDVLEDEDGNFVDMVEITE